MLLLCNVEIGAFHGLFHGIIIYVVTAYSPFIIWVFMNYRLYIRSKEWKRRKQQYALLHPKVCFICGCDEDEGIILHHITYERLGEERDEDLEWLCTNDHLLVHASELPLRTAHITFRKNSTTPVYRRLNKAGDPWLSHEDTALEESFLELSSVETLTESIKRLSKSHRRTTGAIRSRLKKLCIIKADQEELSIFVRMCELEIVVSDLKSRISLIEDGLKCSRKSNA